MRADDEGVIGNVIAARPIDSYLASRMKKLRAQFLDIRADRVVKLATLPLVREASALPNRFDLILLAQARVEGMTLVTANPDLVDRDVEIFLNDSEERNTNRMSVSQRARAGANIYKDYKSEQNSDRSDVNIHIYDDEEQLLDAVILSKHINPVDRGKELIARLKSIELRDYILLGHIVDTLSYSFIDCENQELDYIDLKEQIAWIIGEYLCESNERQEASLRIIGDDGEVWGKSIELLTRESRIKEDAARVDRSLARFFDRFQDVLFPRWEIRKQLYRIGQTGGYQQFRRSLFKAIVRYQELLSSHRDDDNKLLVRVLAELWDSDRQWIVSKHSRLQDLRKILEPLQDLDTTGARILADRVASYLSNFSN